MAKGLKPIDITNTPDVYRLAEEVARSGIPRVLRKDNKDIAIISPAEPNSKSRRKRTKTKADFEAFLSSFGSWKGNVDVDRFLKDIKESRRLTRPPVDL